MKIFAAVAAIGVMLSGCAAGGVYKQPTADFTQRALIETDEQGGGIIAGFGIARMDDQRAGPVGSGLPSQMYVFPGAHVFRVLWQAPLMFSTAQVRMVALPGHDYVVKHEVVDSRMKFWIVDGRTGLPVEAALEKY
jgi:hypothetical protein